MMKELCYNKTVHHSKVGRWAECKAKHNYYKVVHVDIKHQDQPKSNLIAVNPGMQIITGEI